MNSNNDHEHLIEESYVEYPIEENGIIYSESGSNEYIFNDEGNKYGYDIEYETNLYSKNADLVVGSGKYCDNSAIEERETWADEGMTSTSEMIQFDGNTHINGRRLETETKQNLLPIRRRVLSVYEDEDEYYDNERYQQSMNVLKKTKKELMDSLRSKNKGSINNCLIGNEEECLDGDEFVRHMGSNVKKGIAKVGRKQKPKQNDSYESYAAHNIIQFLEHIQMYPAIWDPTDANYHRNEIKNSNFMTIERNCTKFMCLGRPHGSCAKELWKKLFDDYRKYFTRINDAPSGSSSQSVMKFKYSELMKFLDATFHRRSVQNMYVIGDSQNTVSEEYNKKSFRSEAPSTSSKSTKSELVESFKSLVDTYKQSVRRIDDILEESKGNKEKKNDFVDNRWSNLLKVFQEKTKNWSEVDKIVAEGQTISFISSLSKSSETVCNSVIPVMTSDASVTTPTKQ